MHALRAGLPRESPFTTGEADGALLEFDVQRIPELVALLRAIHMDLPETTIEAATEAQRGRNP